jgi:hypothetical protein
MCEPGEAPQPWRSRHGPSAAARWCQTECPGSRATAAPDRGRCPCCAAARGPARHRHARAAQRTWSPRHFASHDTLGAAITRLWLDGCHVELSSCTRSMVPPPITLAALGRPASPQACCGSCATSTSSKTTRQAPPACPLDPRRGMGPSRRTAPGRHPRLLCPPCADALPAGVTSRPSPSPPPLPPPNRGKAPPPARALATPAPTQPCRHTRVVPTARIHTRTPPHPPRSRWPARPRARWRWPPTTAA